MANQRKKAQMSNAVALQRLQTSFNGLLQTLSQKDEVHTIYLAAIADAFYQLAPEKFTGPDGKPLNIYLEYIKREFPHMLDKANGSGE